MATSMANTGSSLRPMAIAGIAWADWITCSGGVRLTRASERRSQAARWQSPAVAVRPPGLAALSAPSPAFFGAGASRVPESASHRVSWLVLPQARDQTPTPATWCLTMFRLGLRSLCLKQETGEVVRREESPVRTLRLAQQGLPAQEVAVTQQYRWCVPGEELTHGRSRIPIVHQVTADE